MVINFLRRSECGEFSAPDGEILSLSGASMVETDRIVSPLSGSSSGSCSLPAVGHPSLGPYTVSLPPVPRVVFALARGHLTSMQPSPLSFPRLVMPEAGKTRDGWAKQAMNLLAEVQRRALCENLLTEPVLALAAWQLPDGSFIRPSAPVLLVPNSEAPLIAGTTEFDKEEMEMQAIMALTRLQFRLSEIPDIEEGLSLALFISEPVSLYDRKAAPTGHHRIQHTAWSHSARQGAGCREHTISSETYVMAWRPQLRLDWEISLDIAATSSFRLISLIPSSRLHELSEFSDVDFSCGGLSRTPDKREIYTPDYAANCAIFAAGSSDVSGRLTLCDLTLTAPDPSTPESLMPRVEGAISSGKTPSITEARLIKNGLTVTARRSVTLSRGSECGEGAFPRFLFYPDPDCREIRIATSDALYRVPMQPHPHLHGAWHWSGSLSHDSLQLMGVEKRPATVAVTEDSITCGSWHEPDSIWRSAKGNRLLWPGSLKMSLDVGRVFCVARAFRASGLVAATAPTAYLFSDVGIFLLREGDDGSLRDAGLISTHVVTVPASIVTEGRRIRFTTSSGESLAIDGTTVKEADAAESKSTLQRRVKIVGTGEYFELTTRTLKLGSPLSRKPVSVVALCGTGAAGITLTLHGGDSLTTLRPIARAKGAIRLLWTPPMRFYRLTLSGHLTSDLEAIIIL